MAYAEQRQRVLDIQKLIARVNHKLENPKINLVDSMELQDERFHLLSEWDREIKIMHAMPEYNGQFKLHA
ncbi:hypothetical protein [Pectobacterium parmentieri]|uniref:hypothetical protein n=1 Tax=Pectobacterium parmentieri TaxID=1905730 RepID=UPI000EACDD83|nr:hypothetical protein [Pectobacterium parmentieri]AYH33262.1 hypothetical protein C5E19_17440 [Pectobacterium parmentieri]QHQ14545.1 hypothetical protein GMW39_00790 [Pectobacterium parmentieri]